MTEKYSRSGALRNHLIQVQELMKILFYLCVHLVAVHCEVPKDKYSLSSPVCQELSTCYHPNVATPREFIADRSCQCDDQCYKYGDCCKDSEHYRPSGLSACVKVGSWNIMDTERDASYYMVETCPPNWVNIKIRQKCEQYLETIKKEPSTGHPITSNATNITYANYYCAMCNNDLHITTMVRWKLKVTCGGNLNVPLPHIDEVLMNATFNNVTGKIKPKFSAEQHTCKLYLWRPRGLLRPCKKDLIDYCPRTYQNDTIRNLCEESTSIIYYKKARPYRNPYCAVCNKKLETSLYCHTETPVLEAFFPMLFDVSGEGNVGKICPHEYEAYDPRAKKCRHVIWSMAGCIGSHCDVLTCTKLVLDPDEFEINDDFTGVDKLTGKIYQMDGFTINKDGHVEVCVEYELTKEKFSDAMKFVTFFGLGVSVLGLILHLLAFAVNPVLRNLSGKNLASLCAALLLAYISFITGQFIEPGEYLQKCSAKSVFGNGVCWFENRRALLIFFVVPVAVVMSLNVVFYSLSTYMICATSVSPSNKSSDEKKNYKLFARLAVLMGLTWITGFIAAFMDIEAGLFIFISFTLTRRVRSGIISQISGDTRTTKNKEGLLKVVEKIVAVYNDIKIKGKKSTCSEDDNNNYNVFSINRNCQCDVQCSRYGDCCQDSEHFTPSSLADCVEVGDWNTLGRIFVDSYYIVKTCPNSWTDTRIQNKCENYLETIKEEPIIGHPITSKVTKITYANYYCARCNDDLKVSTMVRWRLAVTCRDKELTVPDIDTILSNSSFTEDGFIKPRFSAVHHSCNLYVWRPLKLLRRCHKRMVDSCPASWNNTTIVEFCLNHTSFVFAHEAMPYRNQYCAICNGVKEKNLRCVKNVAVLEGGYPIPYSSASASVMDVNNVMIVNKGRVCDNIVKEYDPRSKMCRYIFRSMTGHLENVEHFNCSNGKCHNMSDCTISLLFEPHEYILNDNLTITDLSGEMYNRGEFMITEEGSLEVCFTFVHSGFAYSHTKDYVPFVIMGFSVFGLLTILARLAG
ncbi:hypothetical protein C0J52_16006 [Blattella germanica]|nr:hypothetical protein C0J52_16006 [Blattella germanica]